MTSPQSLTRWSDSNLRDVPSEPDLYGRGAGPWPWMLPSIVGRESTRILDALFGALTMFRTLPGFPGGVPANDVFGIIFIGVLMTRRPTRTLGKAELLPGLCLLLGVYLVLVSMANDVPWLRRLVHLTVIASLAFLVGQGRASIPSLLRGACTALVLNAVLFYAGLAPDSYGGVLTGYLADKNLAALVIGLIGTITAGFVRRSYVLPIMALTSGGVWLTGSRTTLAALLVAWLWVLLRPKMTFLSFRLAFGAAAIGLVTTLENSFSQVGVFANRAGSDLLRERINEAVASKLSTTPWYGGGLGTATVEVQDSTWFFHNSYNGLQQEGGWPFLIVIVAVVVWLGLRPARRQIDDLGELFVEAGTIVLLICAWKLGEVFLATTTYVLLGSALYLYLKDDASTAISTNSERILARYAS